MSVPVPNIDESWTLFIDRDGVINKRDFDGYITQSEKFIFLPGVFEGLKRLRGRFGRIIVVTNQQGVGKGLMSERNLNELHHYMVDKLKEQEIHIDAIYAATNIRGARNDRRKPRPNMALEARQQFKEIDFSKSVMIGDTDGDLRFGMNLGMKTVLVLSDESIEGRPDFIVNDLEELANDWNL
jgi:histidinol-phosphate phosphatase family protein